MSQRELAGDFPPEILEARLEAIGTREALEKKAIDQRGFPFRYHSPLDEAILVLNYFLTKSQQTPGSYLQINSIHVPAKEEENTLASWKSPKAGLYLDLHALIENHNHKKNKRGAIKRLFVFRDHAQLAFLESTGIGVILEQESIGIETGFVLLSEDRNKVSEITSAGVMLVQLLHDDVEKCEWFLGVNREESPHPYLNNFVCKWHKGRVFDERNRLTPEAAKEEPLNIRDLRSYLNLFRFENREPEEKVYDRSYRFETEFPRLKRLLLANYRKAFPDEEVSAKDFEQHLTFRAVPANLEQLLMALDQIKQSSAIRAIDASSVKSTLRVHEADPNYRQWIRTTVQRALKDHESISLERIYILREAQSEYEVLKQEIDLYRDLISNRISRLEPDSENAKKTPSSNVQNPSVNIRLYVITMRVLDDTCHDTDKSTRVTFRDWLKPDFVRKEDLKVTSIMTALDFLYSERVIFNYKDYKGEPGRAYYDADLFVLEDKVPTAGQEITKLSADQFEERRLKYERLFEMLKQRSVQIFPLAEEDFPMLEDLEQQLNAKGIKPITMEEVLNIVPEEKSEADVPAPERPMIFVSYASEDREKVDRICTELRNEGYEVWDYQTDVFVGQHPYATQDRNLNEADFFFCCWSKSYSTKRGQVQRELSQALERETLLRPDDIYFLLARLDDTEVWPEISSNFKYTTLFNENGDWLPEEWEKLLAAIAYGLSLRKS
jgi:hypothetical protein